jgi:glycerol-3-phosphate dehydrogenase
MTSPSFDRRESLRRLGEEHFDLLVIGGGITGCGVALEAAARGLHTALVEGKDFASGTSSKSSKMVHGGLRYLQQHDYLLVYESLHERQRLIRNAPHLVHPLPFLIPLFGKDGVVVKGLARAYSLALWLYDATGGVRIGKRHRRISRSEALHHFPALRADRLVTGFLYWDAQADDARLTLAVARTAAAKGAVIANYAPVEEITEEGGRVNGARLADGTQIRARKVVNAGGVWSQDVLHRTGPHAGGGGGISIRPAKGVHVAVRADRLPCDYASVLAVPGDRRSIFVVPWAADEAPPGGAGAMTAGRYTYIGTTDTDYHGSLDDPRCTREDIDYLLRAVNAWTTAKLTPDDISGTWAGLRPLISDVSNARTADLSRRHKVVVSPDGLVTVTGGKLTTYRKMAADTVDAAVSQRKGVPWRAAPSPTARLTLIGGDNGGTAPAGTETEAHQIGIDPETFVHLEGRHGSETPVVLDICREDPALAEPLVTGMLYIRAEAVYAARHEMVHTVEDMLARRTRAVILDREAAVAAAWPVARLLGGELGWDPVEQARQVDSFLAVVQSEREAEREGEREGEFEAEFRADAEAGRLGAVPRSKPVAS